MPKPKSPTKKARVESYEHTQARTPLRPEVGTQPLFKKKKQPQTYRYDSSLSPALDWDAQNPARERGEALIRRILEAASLDDARAAAEELRALSRPFLNWAGKAERLSFDVPTLPLFIHERLSTEAIIETLKGHRRDRQGELFDLFGDPRHSIVEQVTKAYEFQDDWTNRMILGDSLVVMNSLLHYESLGGQVQMVYIDPPYGVKFGSNFQPFVRKRDVKHNDDEDMTREPEMVQAYRDTWELGLHSYLTYLRDRLLLARELLTSSGSVFVQISDENLHHVREVMDEVFGEDNFCGVITFQKTGGAAPKLLSPIADYLLWFAKNKEQVFYEQIFLPRELGQPGTELFQYVELTDGTVRRLSTEEYIKPSLLPEGARVFQTVSLQSPGVSTNDDGRFEFEGKPYFPNPNSHWKTHPEGRKALVKANRIIKSGEDSLRWKMYLSDYPVIPITNVWTDTQQGGFNDPKVYVVQTNTKVIQRCVLMTTRPGDLVLDPTCGSGTTAYVAEQWGRRWVTIDTSRVPLALARQRLLTATFPYYELKDESLGPAGGFVYKRKQNKKGEEIGGIVPHITLGSIANNEPPKLEVIVDRPEVKSGVTRVTGPFTFEATVPTPVDLDGDGVEDSGAETAAEYGTFVERMIEVLRRSPVLRLGGNRTVTFRNIRPPTRTLSLSAEALVDATAHGQSPTLPDAVQEAREQNAGMLPLSQQPVAFVFGPENGAVSEKLVYDAAREAHAKNYSHLYVIGFAIQPNARELVENCAEVVGIPATYVQATLDLLMGDLLKNMRSSQIFSVCGLPEIKLHRREQNGTPTYQVELLGLDVFDPATLAVEHRKGSDVPAWFLDVDYNSRCFHVSQAFFPRTSAWDNLKKALKGTYEEDVWGHLAGTVSAPFEAGEQGQVAVKVIDDRGNELLVVKSLSEAGK
jgi:adenine-specific DNA-methyltransferase